MIERKPILAVAKLNFRYATWISYLLAGITLVAMIVDMILDHRLNNVGDSTVSIYSMLYLIPLLAPIFIASVNYGKMMHLGVRKLTYFYGCLLNYLVFAAVISLFGVLEFYTLDRILNGDSYTILGLIPVFGWGSNPLTAFFSQFAFLFMAQCVLHTLTFIQTRWYGWAADAVLVVILSVFTPIAPLRQAEVFFFRMTIFAKPAVVQVAVCLLFGAAVYASNLYYLRKRDA